MEVCDYMVTRPDDRKKPLSSEELNRICLTNLVVLVVVIIIALLIVHFLPLQPM